MCEAMKKYDSASSAGPIKFGRNTAAVDYVRLQFFFYITNIYFFIKHRLLTHVLLVKNGMKIKGKIDIVIFSRLTILDRNV